MKGDDLFWLKKRLNHAEQLSISTLNEAKTLELAMQAKMMEYQEHSHEVRMLSEKYNKALKALHGD